MCTAAAYKSGENRFFGRNLDLEALYQSNVVVRPRGIKMEFRNAEPIDRPFAIIGMATVVNNTPLFYDACNEKGIGIAGLNFPEGQYHDVKEQGANIASFELIPWILGQCSTLDEVKNLIADLNVTNISFAPEMPASPLHWMISDGEKHIVVESMPEGLKVYDNPVGVMTNNPSFNYQLRKLEDFHNISAKTTPNGDFGGGYTPNAYSRGMGSQGLPGGLDSSSRFVKVAFTHQNSISGGEGQQDISQFFHILESVYQQRGLCDLGNGKYEYTIYTSCMDLKNHIYHYTSYENHQITAVDMKKENLDGDQLAIYPFLLEEQINHLN